jgi:hypothetical protein
MSGMKREYERIADIMLTGDYEDIRNELMNQEALGMTLGHIVEVIDTLKAIAPYCECGNDYFEGIKQ